MLRTPPKNRLSDGVSDNVNQDSGSSQPLTQSQINEKSRALVKAHLLTNAADFPQRGLSKPVPPKHIDLGIIISREEAINSLRQQAAELHAKANRTHSHSQTSISSNRHLPGALPRTPPKTMPLQGPVIDLSRSPRHIENQIKEIQKLHDPTLSTSVLPSTSVFRPPPALSAKGLQPEFSVAGPSKTHPTSPQTMTVQEDASNYEDSEEIEDSTMKNNRSKKKKQRPKFQARDFLKQKKSPTPNLTSKTQNQSKKRKLSANSSREDFPQLPPPSHPLNTIPNPTIQPIVQPTYTSTIPTSNSFAALESLSDQQDHSQATAMVTSPVANGSKRTNSKKTTPPPPIILTNPADFYTLAKSIQAVCRQNITFTNTKTSKKFQVTDSDDFRAATALLRNKGVEFHTFKLDEERSIKLVLRGIDSSVGVACVKEALQEEHGISVDEVAQLTSHRGDSGASSQQARPKLPLYVTYTKDRVTANKIRQISRLCFCRISSVENFRTLRGPIQCFKCQRFGHTSSFCANSPRCMKCGASHSTHQCEKLRSLPALCANCKQNHTANYRGCQVYQDAMARINHPGQPNPKPRQPRHFAEAPQPNNNVWAQRAALNKPTGQDITVPEPPTSALERTVPNPHALSTANAQAERPAPADLRTVTEPPIGGRQHPIQPIQPWLNQGWAPVVNQQAAQINWQAWHHWANNFLNDILSAPPEQRTQVILSRVLPLSMIPQATVRPTNQNAGKP